MKTALICHQDTMLHNMGPDHPESPMRVAAILNKLQDTRLLQEVDIFRAELAGREAIERVHPGAYIDQLDMIAPKQGRIYADPDTAIMPHTLRAAYLAAGAAVQATDLVMSGDYQTAFCATRPPGHHAERNRVMGFCFFNNIAIAARHAMAAHGLERVAIIDFDVHQGNGTVDIFQNDPRVLFCSSFQHPWYPHSHYCVHRNNIINSPLEAYSGGLEFRQKVEHDWLKALQDHKPQMIFISAGFDAHKLDPLGELQLVEADYRWITDMLMSVAKDHADCRIVSMLEGGYNLKALAGSVEVHLESLAGV